MALVRQGEATLKTNPRDAKLLFDVAMLYFYERRYAAAIQLLRKAAKVQKRDAAILRAMVATYQRMQDFDNAVKAARKLTELAPRDERALIALAEALEHAKSHKAAIGVWERLTRMFSENVDHWQSLAACHRAVGDMGMANEMYEKIATFAPHDAQTLYLHANSKKFDAAEAQGLLKRIEVAIPKTEDPIYVANLHYAAGKLLHECKQYDEAFKQYQMANANRDKHSKFSARQEREFRNVQAAFKRDTFMRLKGIGHRSTDPIFILGMPRSGTTLVESLLGAHPDVTAGDEMRYMSQIAENMSQDSADAIAYSKLIGDLNMSEWERIGEQYLTSVRKKVETKGRFTDKLPHNFLHIGLIRCIFPNAKIIHCRRHPIDNCLSLYSNSMRNFHNTYKNDLTRLGLYYRRYLSLMQFWRDNVPGGFHEVFYEDVVANTELNARQMIDYLGLAWDDAVLKREGSQKSVRTLSAWQVRQPIYTSSAGRWKVYEKHLGPLIEALGPAVSEYEQLLHDMQSGAGA